MATMKRRHSPDPQTPEQWQLAVDAAAGARALADCKMYGLLAGGPEIDVARCDEILNRGVALGIRPSRPVTELAVGLVVAFNEQTMQAGESDAKQ